jgi:hypothetical protein
VDGSQAQYFIPGSLYLTVVLIIDSLKFLSALMVGIQEIGLITPRVHMPLPRTSEIRWQIVGLDAFRPVYIFVNMFGQPLPASTIVLVPKCTIVNVLCQELIDPICV